MCAERGYPGRRDESGATALEYAIMASLVAVVIIAAVTLVGQATRDNLCPSGEGWEQIEAFDTDDC